MTDTTKNIYQRIAAVTAEVKAFEKDGTNPQFHFRFASIEQVVAVIQPICIKYGICLIQEATTDGTVHEFPGSKGINHISTCTVITHAINMDDPTDQVTTTMPGQGYDSLDKGISKAISGGRKYAIYGLFNMHAGDEEPDASHGAPPQQRQAAKPQPARSAQKPPKATGPPTETAKRLRGTLYPELPEWPPQREYQDKYYDIELAAKFLSEPASDGQRKRTRIVAEQAGYKTDDERHELFRALYAAFRVPKAQMVISTMAMMKGHCMFLMNAMENGYFVGKQAADPLPWSGGKATAEPEPEPGTDVNPDMDLEEEEDFFVD